ncbi:hypothetical protein [Leisingera sp. ANG-M7]|uniref:hypothetical protein n=1 Tax=Leisingera sp. ANG-M7 TaxID=1577902 RepID=UPI00057CE1B8|nr:hypothetical protein [Leisingera sp. ANG-M7]KIC35746.1 hypothetical protein RA26_15725 [Leisingera sp. ANG-M7]
MNEVYIYDCSISKSNRKAFKKFVKRADLIKPAKWYLDLMVKHAKKYEKKRTEKHVLGAESLVSLESYNDFGMAHNLDKKGYLGPSTPFYQAVERIMALYMFNYDGKGDFSECCKVFDVEVEKMYRTCIKDWLKVDPIAVAHKLKGGEVCRLISEGMTFRN